MKVIITGAAGSFGGAMVRYFSERGHEVLGVGRQKEPPTGLLKYAAYLCADISKPFELPAADMIIHAAGLSDDKAKMKALYEPNVTGTINTLNAAKRCDKFVFISSSSVYLPQKDPILEEIAGKQNNKQLSDYGMSKLLSEQAIHHHFTGNACFILRGRAFYGPGDTQIIPRMLKLVRKGVFNRPGKMDNHLSMTHFENMGHAIECCYESKLKGINTYNVTDDEEYVMKDILRQLFELIYGRNLPEKEIKLGLLKVLAAFRIGGFTPLLVRALSQNMVLDITKIKSELHFTPQMNFFKAKHDMQQWVQEVGGADALIDPPKGLCWRNFK